MRKPFGLLAMSVMVGYSILTLFLGERILLKENAKLNLGRAMKGGETIEDHAKPLQPGDGAGFSNGHSYEKVTSSTWQRRRHDILLPSIIAAQETRHNVIVANHTNQTISFPASIPQSLLSSSLSTNTKKEPSSSLTTSRTTDAPTASPILSGTTPTTEAETAKFHAINTRSEKDPPIVKVLEADKSSLLTGSEGKQKGAAIPGSNHSDDARSNEKTNRFPTFGTPAFAASCPWILPDGTENTTSSTAASTIDMAATRNNCTILARPNPTSGEGLSQWVAQVTVGFIMSQQAGCRFRLDYGKGIDVGTILEPPSREQPLDWRVPLDDFDFCRNDVNCFVSGVQYNDNDQNAIYQIERVLNGTKKLAYIPSLRNVYNTARSYFDSNNGFRDLARTIPGFDLETSMACSLGALLRLSPRATMYEPTLFTDILPALRAHDALVFGLYIRTGRAELLTKAEATSYIETYARRIADCVLRLEREFVALARQRQSKNTPIARTVWMVITDSQHLKKWMKDEFAAMNATLVNLTDSGESLELPPRVILTTKSRGAHTKPGRNPSTADFAEALLDWYLIGESDAVVGDYKGPSFGDTAAFRTNRPYYKVPTGALGSMCGLQTPVLRWDRPVPALDSVSETRVDFFPHHHPTSSINRVVIAKVPDATTTASRSSTTAPTAVATSTQVPNIVTGNMIDQAIQVSSTLSNRFPTFGTAAFAASCPWIFRNHTSFPALTTLQNTTSTGIQPTSNNCTILVRPSPTSGEGLSSWVARVAVGFIMSQQAGCRFRLDYGKGVDVSAILEPASGEQRLDWRVPVNDFDFCKPDVNCFFGDAEYDVKNHDAIHEIERALNGTKKLAHIPSLRNVYSIAHSHFNSMKGFRELARTIPGFDIETSMACALGCLFRLSPRATSYEPTLFTDILPTMRAQDALVFGLYIRTGRADRPRAAEFESYIETYARRVADCALRVEKDYASRVRASSFARYGRIVWMVVTDSLHLKTWMKKEYTTLNATLVNLTDRGPSIELPPRMILSTKSRGAHTKPRVDPSTTDFAEGLLDWYLIGESDVVVGDFQGYSFGDTAAFRTNRPYYKVGKGTTTDIDSICSLQTPVLQWDRPIEVSDTMREPQENLTPPPSRGLSITRTVTTVTESTAPTRSTTSVETAKSVPMSAQKEDQTAATFTIGDQANQWGNDTSSRFPAFGTPAFAVSCPWIVTNGSSVGVVANLPNASRTVPQRRNNCTILARPNPKSGEGLSSWVTQVAVGFIMSQQAGCRFQMDYGKGIDIGAILEPASEEQKLDWRVPSDDFDFCESDVNCFTASYQYTIANRSQIDEIEKAIGGSIKLAQIPHLRYPYSTDPSYFKLMNSFRDLEKTIPGFNIETSMACSIGSLFRLSPRANMFEPTLFSELLPALHSNDALVMALYVRTGRTEDLMKAEDVEKAQTIGTRVAECAMGIERERFSLVKHKIPRKSFSRIVWMLITDSQHLKSWMRNRYDSSHEVTNDTNHEEGSTGLPPRVVLTTSSRGAHTKLRADPSTADFAEGLLDWFLIGESDIVVGDSNGPSFGSTAAFRTLRPYYKVPRWKGACSLQDLVYRWDRPAPVIDSVAESQMHLPIPGLPITRAVTTGPGSAAEKNNSKV